MSAVERLDRTRRRRPRWDTAPAASVVGYSLVGGGEAGLYPAAAAAEGYSRVGEGGGAVGKALEGNRGPEGELALGSTMAAAGPLATPGSAGLRRGRRCSRRKPSRSFSSRWKLMAASAAPNQAAGLVGQNGGRGPRRRRISSGRSRWSDGRARGGRSGRPASSAGPGWRRWWLPPQGRWRGRRLPLGCRRCGPSGRPPWLLSPGSATAGPPRWPCGWSGAACAGNRDLKSLI